MYSATEAGLLALSPDDPFHELIDGELVEKPTSAAGSLVKGRLCGLLRPAMGRRAGWRLFIGLYIRCGTQVRRPALTAWRYESLPTLPPEDEEIFGLRPDWLCEIGATDPARERVYHQHGVPHLWLVDPPGHTLRVLRFAPQGYEDALLAGRDEVVRAEPFDQVELAVAELFEDGEE